MSELDQIRARLTVRRNAHGWHGGHGSPCTCVPGEAEADLDRAIAIAEKEQQLNVAISEMAREKVTHVSQERDEARALATELHDAMLLLRTYPPGYKNDANTRASTVMRAYRVLKQAWNHA